MKNAPVLSAIPSLAALLLAAPAFGKLPELSPEAKAKAAETAAKTAWTNKVADFQLCKSMDQVAAAYLARAKSEGKAVQTPVTTPACTDPGAFVYTPPADAKPIEAAGAHSPPQTAAAPPNGTTPAADTPKK